MQKMNYKLNEIWSFQTGIVLIYLIQIFEGVSNVLTFLNIFMISMDSLYSIESSHLYLKEILPIKGYNTSQLVTLTLFP